MISMKKNGAFSCLTRRSGKKLGEIPVIWDVLFFFLFLRDEFGFCGGWWLCFLLFSEGIGFLEPPLRPNQRYLAEKVTGWGRPWLTRWFHKKGKDLMDLNMMMGMDSHLSKFTCPIKYVLNVSLDELLIVTVDISNKILFITTIFGSFWYDGLLGLRYCGSSPK